MNIKLLFFSMIILIFSACQSDSTSTASTPTTQQSAAATEDPAKELMDYVRAHPTEHDVNSTKLNEAAKIYLENKRYQSAISCLNQSVRNHYSGTAMIPNALMMADLYRNKFKKPNMADVVHQSLNATFPDDPIVKKAMEMSPVTIPAIGTFLTDMTSKLTDPKTGKIVVEVADEYVTAAELHAMLEPKDAENPNYLHKGAEIARSMRAFPKAIDLYTWIYTKYPDSSKAAQAMFMAAFTFDNELQQKDKAKALYNEFLKRYPNDDFADDTKFLLENLGKSNEEIIEGFGTKK